MAVNYGKYDCAKEKQCSAGMKCKWDLRWSCCRPSPSRWSRCAAAPAPSPPPLVAPHGGWSWCQSRSGGEAVRAGESGVQSESTANIRMAQKIPTPQVGGVTHRLVTLLKVAALPHQAELVLWVVLRGRAWGPVHQGAGPGVVTGHALRVLPASLRSSEGASRRLTRLETTTVMVSLEQPD